MYGPVKHPACTPIGPAAHEVVPKPARTAYRGADRPPSCHPSDAGRAALLGRRQGRAFLWRAGW
ncbi:hypothetical protein DF186_22225, partial [Enterococcus hirae]